MPFLLGGSSNESRNQGRMERRQSELGARLGRIITAWSTASLPRMPKCPWIQQKDIGSRWQSDHTCVHFFTIDSWLDFSCDVTEAIELVSRVKFSLVHKTSGLPNQKIKPSLCAWTRFCKKVGRFILGHSKQFSTLPNILFNCQKKNKKKLGVKDLTRSFYSRFTLFLVPLDVFTPAHLFLSIVLYKALYTRRVKVSDCLA